MKKLLLLVTVLLSILNGIVFVESFKFNESQVAPVTPYAPPVVIQEPNILKRLQYLGATDTSELNLVYSDTLPENARGMYGNNGTLSMNTDLDQVQFDRTLAHEYLHYMWDVAMTDEDRSYIDTTTRSLYTNDPYMQQRMALYVQYDRFSSNELFAIYCTESSDGFISTILDVCNKYIDRTRLILLR